MSFGGGFLRFPDLFPGRRSGEAWGGRSVTLDVAGGPYLFTGLSAAQEEAVHGKFAGLCCETPAEGAVATGVFRAPAADFLEFDLRGWEYALDMEHSPNSVLLAGLRLMARLDWTPALSGGLWTSEAAGEEWTSVFENYLRVLTAYRLLEEGGAVLHSAGISDGTSAWLLLGPSGAGKTTSSRLCLAQGGMVLSDDLNAVLPSGPRVVRLPFTGDLGERSGGPASYPLAAVLRLVQGPEDHLRAVSPAAALAGLVAAAPFVNRDPWRREMLLGLLERLARSVPSYELTFSLQSRVWDILRSIPQ
ncbi:MAG TPA: hypothetical protein VGX68_19945 [Thermoanaerobaculia bacterium]|jgi:hypothetical protein|nr:hypothetical protein [Thermoanaerobaculia bacterium]